MTAWDDTFVDVTASSGADTTQLLVGNVADPEKRGCTLVRMLIRLWVNQSTPGVVSGIQALTMGIGLSSDDAFTANALPEVQVADDFPQTGWLFRDQVLVLDETLATGVFAAISVREDVRSQRKLDRASAYIRISNVAVEGTSFSVRCKGLIRALYKLP